VRSTPGPLGVFDSGVGGLTVVTALRRRFPGESFLYIADQAHVPYGGRPLDEVCGFARGISRFLARDGCRAVIMGCNISSAVALPLVAAELAPLTVIGTIAGVAKRAAAGESPRIGVLATAGTVQSGAYTAHILRCNASARVTEVACPRFVPLIETGVTDGADARDAAREYLSPLAEAGCTRIILGCTHYPFVMPVLRSAATTLSLSNAAFLDPADDIADALAAALPDLRTVSTPSLGSLLTTGDPRAFRDQARRWLPDESFDTGAAKWSEGEKRLLRRL
jgi:glutamate racemase